MFCSSSRQLFSTGVVFFALFHHRVVKPLLYHFWSCLSSTTTSHLHTNDQFYCISHPLFNFLNCFLYKCTVPRPLTGLSRRLNKLPEIILSNSCVSRFLLWWKMAMMVVLAAVLLTYGVSPGIAMVGLLHCNCCALTSVRCKTRKQD